MILKGRTLGSVSHYFFKKEYQACGAPHYHAVVWIEGAPCLGKDPPQKIMSWIQEHITCRIPEVSTNPELHKLVNKYQRHKCSNYYKKRQKFGSAYVARCTFSSPCEASESGKLNAVDKAL